MRRRKARIRLSRPGDILGVVPYLVGFHPKESIVAVMLRSGRVVLTIRVDLPPPSEAIDLAAHIVRVAGQHRAQDLVLIAYSVDPQAREVLTEVATELADCELQDVLFVDGQRWWSLVCTGGCCPPDGRPYDPSSSAVAAQAVYAGLAARPDRRALEADVGGPTEEEHATLSRLVQQESAHVDGLGLAARCDLMRTVIEASLAQQEPLDDPTCARLALLARDVPVRDVAWAMISWKDAEHHRRVWARVVARTVAPLEAAPLCLLGFCAWICGDGAMMNCCIQRVTDVDPDYSFGQLLAKISQQALSPQLWNEVGPADGKQRRSIIR
ncbi:MAG TPA: DUF4192 domain-containing protein [Propionibacteriaceae bacterium]|jgi:hypothetical protein|nr:DUF4192 domain-containing protein [Propionibacteriaceae bacterium]